MDKINELVQLLIDGVKQGSVFVNEQAPSVIHDLLKWEIVWGYVVGISLIMLFIVLVFLIVCIVEKIAKHDGEVRIVYAFSMVLIILLITGFSQVLRAVKAQVTPKAAIIDILTRLAK